MDRDNAFREFVAARGRSLMRTAYLLTGDRHQAEDLLQDVLIKVADRWWRIRQEEKAEAYARTALVREYISWRRLRRSTELPVDDVPEQSTADFAEHSLSRLTLDRALARLAPRQRAVLVLRFYEDCSVGQTAALLGCSTGSVKSQTHDALAKLRSLGPELSDLLSDTELVAQMGENR
ncbi:SigE family RNA polymerase sigma factor [Flindersiella endophytica]